MPALFHPLLLCWKSLCCPRLPAGHQPWGRQVATEKSPRHKTEALQSSGSMWTDYGEGGSPRDLKSEVQGAHSYLFTNPVFISQDTWDTSPFALANFRFSKDTQSCVCPGSRGQAGDTGSEKAGPLTHCHSAFPLSPHSHVSDLFQRGTPAFPERLRT